MIRPKPSKDAETYGLEESSLVGPPLPGGVIVAETADKLIDLVAAEMVVQAKACVREFGDFELALCGGSTPQPLYERLMYDPDCRQLPWRRTHLWLVDERAVPFDDSRSNFRLINETIVDHSGIPAEQVHPIMALSETADIDYESKLRDVLQWRERGEDRLDFVLLGMGADGHIASLFPFSDVLGESVHLVRRVTVPAADPPQRVTMTYPLINAARVVAVLVTGSQKAQTLQRVSGGDDSREALPIKGVRPVNGELKWFLDAEACTAGPAPTA
jgi:6-phosphogluconolactonase